MDFEGNENELSNRQKEVLKIYRSYHKANKHKMEPIPVCELPKELKENLLSL
jgi:NAD+ synthase